VNASARLSFANVPREAFSANLAQATGAAAQIEAGTIELTVHDLGSIDLAVAAYSRAHNIGSDDARRAILDSTRRRAMRSSEPIPMPAPSSTRSAALSRRRGKP